MYLHVTHYVLDCSYILSLQWTFTISDHSEPVVAHGVMGDRLFLAQSIGNISLTCIYRLCNSCCLSLHRRTYKQIFNHKLPGMHYLNWSITFIADPLCIGSICMKRLQFLLFLDFVYIVFSPSASRGGTLGISGWGCAAGTLEPLTYTRASSAEFCHPILE